MFNFNVDSWRVIYEPPSGMQINDAIQILLARAQVCDEVVYFTFNGTESQVEPGDSLPAAVSRYWSTRSFMDR
jgi:DMSO/TMAO reductase YedYZ molybdopterin-dependent catalytic subunit